MTENQPSLQMPQRDAWWVAAGTLAAAWLSVHFELSEALYGWTRQRERFQLDEWPGVLLAFALLLIWFAWRRQRELQRELSRRRAAESQLAAALDDNRRLVQQLVNAQEAERKRLARELHDELGQYLNATQLDAIAVRDLARRAGLHEAVTASAAIVLNIDHVQRVVGGLMRELRPVALDDLGLAAALEHCVDTWRQRAPGCRIHLTVEGVDGLDEMHSMTLFRLVQEALTNVARHAAATRVSVALRRAGESSAEDRTGDILVEVRDDGRGADLRTPRAGLGLIGMRERVQALGGTLVFESMPGRGFLVRATLPAQNGDAAASTPAGIFGASVSGDGAESGPQPRSFPA